MDPYNLRAEELAIGECTREVEVRRMWSEKEMVRSFGGQHFPGTPDGMFENWEGILTCVQVVRVPLVLGQSLEEMQETLAQSLLTKVVKSQQWLRASHIVPNDFVIFCWLPFTIPDTVAEHAEAMMERVRTLDSRFSLRLRVPAQAGALFPALFAHRSEQWKTDRKTGKSSLARSRSLSEGDVSTYTGSDAESDDEEGCEWDITWAWELEWSCAEEEQEEQEEQVAEEEQVQSGAETDDEDLAGWHEEGKDEVADEEDEGSRKRLIWDDGG